MFAQDLRASRWPTRPRPALGVKPARPSPCATTLRMTLGSASPPTSRHRHPAAASGGGVSRPAFPPTKTVSCSGKCVKTCSTTPGQRRQSAGSSGASGSRLRTVVIGRATRCRAPRPCRRAGPWAARVRTSMRAVRRHGDEGRAAAQLARRPSSPCAGRSPACPRCARPARLAPGAEPAGRAACGVQIVAPRSIIAWAKSPGPRVEASASRPAP